MPLTRRLQPARRIKRGALTPRGFGRRGVGVAKEADLSQSLPTLGNGWACFPGSASTIKPEDHQDVAGIFDPNQDLDSARQGFKHRLGERIVVGFRVERRGHWPPHVPNSRDLEPSISELIHSVHCPIFTYLAPGRGNHDERRLRSRTTCCVLRSRWPRRPFVVSSSGGITQPALLPVPAVPKHG